MARSIPASAIARIAPGQPHTVQLQYGPAQAQLSGDGRITTLALAALKRGTEAVGALVPVLFDVEDHPEFLPAPLPLPTEYDRFFEHQTIARIRHDSMALTLAADHSGHFYCDVRNQWGGRKYSDDWFHLHVKDIVVESIQLAPAGMLAIQPRTTDARAMARIDWRVKRGWTHTLHFRPGSPPLEMPSNVKHVEDVCWKDRSVLVHLQCDAPNYSLIASLNLWIRSGIELIEDGAATRKINAGETINLKGGPLTLVSAGGNRLRLSGLPPSQHHMRIVPAEPIPSSKPRECGLLCLGLRMPVDLQLEFTY